jgi:hypothetical protein
MDHVLIRPLEFLTGNGAAPSLRFGVELRDRPGPLHKHGAFEDDRVWVQLEGGLMVARAVVRICWVGEYSDVESVRARTRGAAVHALDGFWHGRPKYGYAAVAELTGERWVEPFWAGPRNYGYEWVRLESEAKERSWLDPKPHPRGGEGLADRFAAWLAVH